MKKIFKEIESASLSVEKASADAMKVTEKAIRPMRNSFIRRFPVLSMLIVTFGVGATFYGVERILMKIEWLNDRPFFIFLIGITILAVFGKLYKKLE